MSTATPSTIAPACEASTPSRERDTFRGDSFALGIIVMLVMTIVGRGIGFFRGMAFCRLMDDTDVGRWSMAFGFITLITPVMLLGIPGALPRFTEHFRLRGTLSLFVRRTAIGTLACTGMFVAAMLAMPDRFGWIVFLQAESPALMQSVAAAVVGMIVYNFVSDLSGSLRLVRVVSAMQFIQGVGFTCLSVAWLMSGGGFTGVVWMFGLSCLLATLPGCWALSRRWASACESVSEPVENESSNWWPMIRRLAPYAFAIWMMNLIGNLFELSDRYMILHFIPTGDDFASRELAGQAAVGQYHSGRIIPMVLLSLGTMIGGVLVPYLAADWEAKRFQSVVARFHDTLLSVSVVFTAGSGFAILLGPWLFSTLLQGRYSDGLMVMPMALCFCTWSALVMIGQSYLWTAEKGKWVAVAMLAGLVSNVALNALLLPRMGLSGAVIATLCSHAVVMIGVWIAMIACGYKLDRSLLVASLLPASLLISGWLAIGVTIVIASIIAADSDRRLRLLNSIPEKIRQRLPGLQS